MDNRHLAGNGGEIKGLVMPRHIYGGSKIGGRDGKSSGDVRRHPAMRDVLRMSFVLGRNPAPGDGAGRTTADANLTNWE